jgi:phage terminase small subunit
MAQRTMKPRMTERKKPIKKAAASAALSPRQQRFVDEYLIDRNATAAYKRAGYAHTGAAAGAARLLAKVKVREAVDARLAEAAEKSGLTIERVQRAIAQRCFGDIRKAFDEHGNLLPIHQLDEDTAMAIDAFDITESGGGERPIVLTKKLKFADKTAALTLAARHLGMLEKDNVQLGGALGAAFGDMMARIQQSGAGKLMPKSSGGRSEG